jgi:hypothetical protein
LGGFRPHPAQKSRSFCGGWTVDAWLGHQTRSHGDVDLTIFHEDQRAIFEYFGDGWLLNGHDVHNEDGTEPWDGRTLEFPSHIHGYADAFNLDIQLNRRSGDEWIFSRQHDITLPISHCITMSPWGIPTLAPEAILFYKAIGSPIRPHDETDFHILSPTLSDSARAWLGEAITRLRPGHAWLDVLTDTSQLNDLVARIVALDRPRSVIAISGFGGSGKSTLAEAVRRRLDDTAVVAADNFWTNRAVGRSVDWADLDRGRLRTQVLEPFRRDGTIRYQIYDWDEDRPVQWRSHDGVHRLIVEGVGLLHPDTKHLYDYMVWIDCEPTKATERAIRRDQLQGSGSENEELWWNTWAPNDADFFAKYRPDRAADFVYRAAG